MGRTEVEKFTQEVAGSTIAQLASSFTEVGLPFHSTVKEVARESGLNYPQVVKAVLEGTSPVPTLLEDANGIPVNGNLPRAIARSVPWKRVKRYGYPAAHLGEGRLRIETIPPQLSTSPAEIPSEPITIKEDRHPLRNFLTAVSGAIFRFFKKT